MASPAQTIRHRLLNTFLSRHSVWFLCLLIFITLSYFELFDNPQYPEYFLSTPVIHSLWLMSFLLSLLGVYDVLQNRHSILKNYPIMVMPVS